MGSRFEFVSKTPYLEIMCARWAAEAMETVCHMATTLRYIETTPGKVRL